MDIKTALKIGKGMERSIPYMMPLPGVGITIKEVLEALYVLASNWPPNQEVTVGGCDKIKTCGVYKKFGKCGLDICPDNATNEL